MNKLKEYRLKYHLTQQQLANKLSVSRLVITFIENGYYLPSLVVAHKMAKFFHTSIEKLFFEDKEDINHNNKKEVSKNDGQ